MKSYCLFVAREPASASFHTSQDLKSNIMAEFNGLTEQSGDKVRRRKCNEPYEVSMKASNTYLPRYLVKRG